MKKNLLIATLSVLSCAFILNAAITSSVAYARLPEDVVNQKNTPDSKTSGKTPNSQTSGKGLPGGNSESNAYGVNIKNTETTNPDGSVTKTQTINGSTQKETTYKDGRVVQESQSTYNGIESSKVTVTNPDGTKSSTTTQKTEAGTITTTTTADGKTVTQSNGVAYGVKSETVTVKEKDGSSVSYTKTGDNSYIKKTVDANGKTETTRATAAEFEDARKGAEAQKVTPESVANESKNPDNSTSGTGTPNGTTNGGKTPNDKTTGTGTTDPALAGIQEGTNELTGMSSFEMLMQNLKAKDVEVAQGLLRQGGSEANEGAIDKLADMNDAITVKFETERQADYATEALATLGKANDAITVKFETERQTDYATEALATLGKANDAITVKFETEEQGFLVKATPDGEFLGNSRDEMNQGAHEFAGTLGGYVTTTPDGKLLADSGFRQKIQARELDMHDALLQDDLMALDLRLRVLAWAGYHYWILDYGLAREYVLRPWEFGYLSYHSALGDTMGDFSDAESWYNTIHSGVSLGMQVVGAIPDVIGGIADIGDILTGGDGNTGVGESMDIGRVPSVPEIAQDVAGIPGKVIRDIFN